MKVPGTSDELDIERLQELEALRPERLYEDFLREQVDPMSRAEVREALGWN